jgi:PHD/YefM family antitoxin component YafN of YafNO toxin-antitoxin module
MKAKVITSTEVQTHFGKVIDSVVQDRMRYIIQRRDVPQAIILSLSDLEQLLSNASERDKMNTVIREIGPVYELGKTLDIPE